MERKPSRTEQALYLLTAVLTLAAVAWQAVPPHQRDLMVMRLLARCRDVAAQVAARQGHDGMGQELRGRLAEAGRFYRVAYRVSCWRDRLTSALEDMRP